MIMCGGRLYEFENGAYYNASRLHNLVTWLDDDILFGEVYEIEFCKLSEIYSGISRPPIDSSSLLCQLPYDN